MGAGYFGRVTADNEMFAGWVARMKDRFRTARAPVGAGKPAAAPGRQAQATSPPPRG